MSDRAETPGLISCIIPVYNRSDLIVECVDSVLNQSYRHYEIIIIDDGSTDDTPQVLKALSAKHPTVIKVVRQQNMGPGAARQTGLNHSSGQFVQFLDSDDLIKADKFELMINEFNGADSPDIVFCITHHYLKEQPEKYIIWKKEHHRTTSILPGFLVSRAWSTSTPIYKKSLLDNAGDILPLSCEEDLEIDCRIGLQSPKLKFINKHLTDFRGHRGQRFSVNHPDRAGQLSDQIVARQKIYQTIKRFKLPTQSEEVTFFSKSMFLLARQTGEMGLIEQSNLALQVSLDSAERQGLSLRIPSIFYRALCSLFGTRRGSALFNVAYDRLHRIKKRRTG